MTIETSPPLVNIAPLSAFKCQAKEDRILILFCRSDLIDMFRLAIQKPPDPFLDEDALVYLKMTLFDLVLFRLVDLRCISQTKIVEIIYPSTGWVLVIGY